MPRPKIFFKGTDFLSALIVAFRTQSHVYIKKNIIKELSQLFLNYLTQ